MLPAAPAIAGSATEASSADAAMRRPYEPVSTSTWSTTWQALVPGTQTVTLMKGELKARPSLPLSTVSATTFDVSLPPVPEPGGGGVVTTGAGAPPPPPPPQAVRESETVIAAAASRTLKIRIVCAGRS